MVAQGGHNGITASCKRKAQEPNRELPDTNRPGLYSLLGMPPTASPCGYYQDVEKTSLDLPP